MAIVTEYAMSKFSPPYGDKLKSDHYSMACVCRVFPSPCGDKLKYKKERLL